MCRGPRPPRACRHGPAVGGLQRLLGRAHQIPNPASCRRIRPLAGSSTQIRMGAGTHTLPCPAAEEVARCPNHPHQPLTWRLRTDKARTRRSINRAKRTTRPGAPLPRRAYSPDAPNARATVHEATRRSCHSHDPTERPTRSHARVGMTFLPAASDGDDTNGSRGQGCAQLPLCDQPRIKPIPDTPRPKVLLSRASSALTARRPFASHSNRDVVA